MELRDIDDNRFYGHIGVKANFTDSNGDTLYVGDVVRIESSTLSSTSIVCGDIADKKFNVIGIWGEHYFSNNSYWRCYKEKSYKSMKAGDIVHGLTYAENEYKEMTVSEIEKELGYPIKVVKEREDN